MTTGTSNWTDKEQEILSALESPDNGDVGETPFSEDEQEMLSALDQEPGGVSTEGKQSLGDMAWKGAKRAYAYPATFVAAGITDTGAAAVAGGGAGMALADPDAPEQHATAIVEDISMWASEHVTMPVLEFIGPDEEMKEAHENIGWVFNKVMDAAAEAGARKFETPLKILELAGQDVTAARAAIDAGSRTAVVAAMFMIPFARKGFGGKASKKDGFSSDEWNTILNTDVKHSEVPRLTYKGKPGEESVGQPGKPRADRLLEDNQHNANGTVIEGEWIPRAENPMYTGADSAIITPVDYATFRQQVQPKRNGQVVYEDVHGDYANYLTHIDGVNVRLQTLQRELGMDAGPAMGEKLLSNPVFKERAARIVMEAMAKHYTTAQKALGEIQPDAHMAAAAGEVRLRTSALILHDDAFGMALAKIVGMKNFEGMQRRLPEKGKKELIAMLDRVGKRKKLGGPRYGSRDKLETLQEAATRRFGPDAIYRMGSTGTQVRGGKLAGMRAEGLDGNSLRKAHEGPQQYQQRGGIKFPETDVLPIDTRKLDLTYGEHMSLHRELMTLREGVRLPTGEIIFRDKGLDAPLGQQVVARHGQKAVEEGQVVAVSERGETYTAGEVQMLRAMVTDFYKDRPAPSTMLLATIDETKAVVDFRTRAIVLGREHRFKGSRLEDFGMETNEKGTIYKSERKTGAEYAEAKKTADARTRILEDAYSAGIAKRVGVQRVKEKYRAKEFRAEAARVKRNLGAQEKSTKARADKITEAHRQTPSKTLNAAVGHVQRPLRKHIDDIYGGKKANGEATTLELLTTIAKELGVEKPGRSLRALRSAIKAHMADAGMWDYPTAQRKGRTQAAFDNRVVPKDRPAPGKRKFIDMEIDEAIINPEEGGTLNLADDLLWREPEVMQTHVERTLNSGKMGKQKGAVLPDLGIGALADAVARKWAHKAKTESKPWDPEKRSVRQKSDWGLWTSTKQVLGGQIMGPLFERTARHSAQGKPEMGRLSAMIDQLPRHLWTAAIGNVKSYYQVRMKHIGKLLTSEKNPLSLQLLLNKFEAKYMTGPRQYVGAIPGLRRFGLTMHRIKPRMNRLTFEDMNSGVKPKTEMGKAFRQYYDNLYKYAQAHGLQVAKYEGHYYPPVFKHKAMMTEGPLRARFIKQARRNGIPEEITHEWMSAMIDGEGLVSIRPNVRDKRSMGGENKNLELNRYFLSKFTPSQLKPFLVDDVAAVAQKYATDLATRVADVERFGKGEVTWQRQLDAAMKEAEEMGDPFSSKELEQVKIAREVLAHTYGRGSKRFAEFQRLGIAAENWSKLGMVVPGSISEPAIALMNPTMALHFAKALATAGVPQMARNIARAIYRDVGRSRAEEVAMDTGRVASVAMHEHLTALNAADMGSTWSSLAFIVNGQHTMTNGLLTTAAQGFESALHRVARDEGQIRLGRRKETDIHKYDRQMLKQYGLDMDKSLKWMRDGARLDGAFYWNEVIPAVLKYQNDVVLTPRGVNLSPWMNKTKYAAVRHLMTYVTMFGNKVTPELVSGLKGQILDGAPNTMVTRGRTRMAAMGSIMSLYALAMLSEELMDLYKFGGSDKHPIRAQLDETEYAMERIMRYVNRTGLTGLAGARLLDILEASQHRSLMGKDVVDNLVGPLWGDVAEITAMGIMAMQGELSSKAFAKQLVSMMPENTMLPRTKDAPAADAIVSREELIDAMEEWLVDQGFPRSGGSGKSWGKGWK